VEKHPNELHILHFSRERLPALWAADEVLPQDSIFNATFHRVRDQFSCL
jgi:hypothetical protein